LVNETTNLNYFTKERNERFVFIVLCFKTRNLKMNYFLFFSSIEKKGKMTTSQDQETKSGPITDCKESLTIPNRNIKADSQTCLKTLPKKIQEIF
jgi:hypothetical protein